VIPIRDNGKLVRQLVEIPLIAPGITRRIKPPVFTNLYEIVKNRVPRGISLFSDVQFVRLEGPAVLSYLRLSQPEGVLP